MNKHTTLGLYPLLGTLKYWGTVPVPIASILSIVEEGSVTSIVLTRFLLCSFTALFWGKDSNFE